MAVSSEILLTMTAVSHTTNSEVVSVPWFAPGLGSRIAEFLVYIYSASKLRVCLLDSERKAD